MKTIYTAAALLLIILLSFTAAPTASDSTETADYIERSYIRFCEVRGYDPDDDHDNEFNDTWRGSIEEESAMSDEF